MTLEKCAICPNTEDPRFGFTLEGTTYPLCDGCGGPENEAQRRDLIERLASLPPPRHSLTVGDHVRCKRSERVGRVTEIGRSSARVSYPWGQPSIAWVHMSALERMVVSWEPAVLPDKSEGEGT